MPESACELKKDSRVEIVLIGYFFILYLSLSLPTLTMALRLVQNPVLRSTARLVARQQPMGLVKIHSCKMKNIHPP